MNKRIEHAEKGAGAPLKINISPQKITRALTGIVAVLLLANLVIIYLRFAKGYEHLRGFVVGFYFDAEANFPSLYSASAILLCAGLLWLIGNLESEKHERNTFYWKFLAVLFLFLAMDEFASLHEYLIQPLQKMINHQQGNLGYLYFAWIIPYAILCVVVGFTILRFFFRIPVRTRVMFAIAGTIFITGAGVMEMIGGKYWEDQGWAIDEANKINATYALIVTLEELLEMVGIIIFVHALAAYYLRRQRICLHILMADREDYSVNHEAANVQAFNKTR